MADQRSEYLRGAKSLPDDLVRLTRTMKELTPAQQRRADRELAEVAADIRRRRAAADRLSDTPITPEPPTEPD